MRPPDCEAEFLHTLGAVGFPQIRAGAIAATPIAEPEPRIGCRIWRLPLGLPPLAATVTGACTRILTGPSRDGAMILPEIVHPVGHDHPLRQTGEGMIQGLDGFLRLACPWPVELANQCFFWVSLRTTGLPHAGYSSLSRAIFVNGASRCLHSPVRWRCWALRRTQSCCRNQRLTTVTLMVMPGSVAKRSTMSCGVRLGHWTVAFMGEPAG
jgi:hypothetical protein